MIKRKSVASLGNARAILARAEQVVDVLRTRYVCQCWKLDEEAAARMLRYFRRKAAGAPDNDEEWQAVVAFCGEHGQSLDWIVQGDPAGMICSAAARSRRSIARHDQDGEAGALRQASGGVERMSR
jgi:hypothetical protein